MIPTALKSRRVPLSILSFFLSLAPLSCTKPKNGASQAFATETAPPTAQQALRGACVEAGSAWCKEYSQRRANLDAYLQSHRDDFKSFATASLGHSGFPYILLRLAPELFPDLIAAQGKDFARLGFAADTFNPKSGLPLGLNYSSKAIQFAGIPIQTPIHVATLSCGACHIGRVAGPDGQLIELVGAGNSHFDSSGLFKMFLNIVDHPNYRADRVRAAIESKPAGWFYGNNTDQGIQEAVERQLYLTLTDQVLASIKGFVHKTIERQNTFINQTAYVPTGAANYFDRTPGRADAVGLALAYYVNEDQTHEMPKTPTITKIMSIWAQNKRQISHWTGDMPSGIHPVVAAAVAVVNETKHLNVDNILRSTRFIDQLPPPPYPFAVDMERVKRGKVLYDSYCASCHQGDQRVYPYSELGTDPARLGSPSKLTYAGFNKALHEGCPKNELGKACFNDDQPVLRPLDWSIGYVATPLDGIWARAPYLHNGSVPTLYHLLVPRQRPARFIVGSMQYDTAMVGFEWQQPMENTEVYITGRPGQMSGGHDSAAYLGPINWETEVERRLDLMEYMKTL